MSFGEIVSSNGENVKGGEQSPVEKRIGITQENLEELRAEFLSTGGIVTSLPQPSEVRDFTLISIMSRDLDGNDVANLHMMIDGKWFSLNDYKPVPTHAAGSADQFDTNQSITIVSQNGLVEITAGWTNNLVNNMSFSDGLFTINLGGEYHIIWSISFKSSGDGIDYEFGIVVNTAKKNRGWAQNYITTGAETESLSASAIIELKAGDKVGLGVINETNTTNLTIEHASFTIMRIR